ncbi:THAP domain-containing protein 5 [Arapaima gigas]
MPRYCAAKLCKNRGGVLSKDNKKISFYPFPLQDEERLRKWVDNMERKEWIPSRHQYLCSEHFTEDSFDLRWGIRYLKNTAVPTIFPFGYDTEEVPNTQGKKNSKSKPGVNAKLNRSTSPVKTKVLPFEKEPLNDNQVPSNGGALACEPGVDGTQVQDVFVLSDLHPDGSSLCKVVHTQALPPGFGESASRQPGDSTLIDTGLSMRSEAQRSPSSAPSSPSATSNALQAAVSQTVGRLSSAACGEDLQRAALSLERGPLEEHSYSRQDMDKNQLWNKIASLHMKILELEKREEGTMAQINSLENTIAQLRKENIVCEEKQRALEGYFTAVIL